MQQLVQLDRRADVEAAARNMERVPIAQLALHWPPPVTQPRRILCIGVNYALPMPLSRIAQPTGVESPVVFTLFPSSIVGHDEPIIRPHASTKFDWEGELAVIIGRRWSPCA